MPNFPWGLRIAPVYARLMAGQRAKVVPAILLPMTPRSRARNDLKSGSWVQISDFSPKFQKFTAIFVDERKLIK